MGEGQMWSASTGWGEAKYVLESHNLSPIELSAKEGLALINGTQLITSIGAEATERASLIAKQADIVAAITLEVLKGTSRAFDSDVHALRAHKGQNIVARKLRSLLHSETFPSEIAQSHRFCNRVQVKPNLIDILRQVSIHDATTLRTRTHCGARRRCTASRTTLSSLSAASSRPRSTAPRTTPSCSRSGERRSPPATSTENIPPRLSTICPSGSMNWRL